MSALASLSSLASFAEEVAAAGAAAALGCSQSGWKVEDKGVGGAFDPVTNADRASERAMRALIEERFPDHAIAGEEFGEKGGTGRYCWSLDPIDGTRSFICALPSWTVLVALLEEGRPVIGAIAAPALGERFIGYGDVGRITTAEGSWPLSTSGCRTIGEARLSTTDPYLFSDRDRAAFDRVGKAARLTRLGLDGYAYAKLASGGLDLVVESRLAPHDINALIPIVIAAGGAVSNWSGEEDFSQGAIVAAASRALLDEAVALLR